MQDTLNQYGYGFQVKVLSSMITDRDFISQTVDLIDLGYFDSKSLQWLVEKTIHYFSEYKLLPTLEVFKVQISNLEENSVFRTEVVKTLKDAWQGIESTDLPFVKNTTIDFCKNQEIKKAILKSVDSLKAGDYDTIRVLINDALKKGMSDKVGHDYTTEIDYRYSEEELEVKKIPTGWKVIDELLGGGMPRGKMGAIMAPTGVGKSWVLSHIGANALKLGNTVLHITLELDEVYVGRRYDAILTGYMMDDMKYHLSELKKVLDKIKSKLIIKYFPSGTLSLNGLESYLEKLKLLGIVPDLIILDYAELMRMSNNKNQRTDEILARLYTDLRGLAGIFDVALWTADQSNRCLKFDTKIEVKNKGVINIIDAKKGDEILTAHGYRLINKVYPTKTQSVYRIKLKNGKMIECSKDHKFPTVDGILKSIATGLGVGDSLLTKS